MGFVLITFLFFLVFIPILVFNATRNSYIENPNRVKDQNSKYPDFVEKLWSRIAFEVEKRSVNYLKRYFSSSMEIGAVLFDRQRNLRWSGPIGVKYLDNLGITLRL